MRTRITSALVGAPLLLAAVLWRGGPTPFSGWPFAALVLAMLLVGLSEYFNGCRELGCEPQQAFGYAAGFLFFYLATPLVPNQAPFALPLILTLLVIISLILEVLKPKPAPIRNVAPTWLGVLFIGWLFPFALRLRLLTHRDLAGMHWNLPANWMLDFGQGAWLVVFTVVLTTALDSGAYFAGKTMGKHKLAPIVSPGKTWEGAVGGFIATLLLGLAFAKAVGLPLTFALTAGIVVGVLGQLADLSKSAIKREIGIKDFGTLIPGHGGVLDRFDSLLYAAPAVYWLALLWR
jgi:phosphatidate cytidylyltransferase